MSDELKRCPFCGGEAEFIRKGNIRQSNQVSCTDCGVELEDGATFNHEYAWNNRPAERQLIAEFLDMQKKYLKAKVKLRGVCGSANKLHAALTEIRDHQGCVAVIRRIASKALDEVEG